MMRHLDFNCDLGEGCGDDAAIMPFISSASIACGGHAGNESTMRDALRLCKQHGIAAGAHPSYPDREQFGRRVLDIGMDALREALQAQLHEFATLAAEEGVVIAHVKPHGALYNRAASDAATANVVIDALKSLQPVPMLYALSGSLLAQRAEAAGLRVVHEVFAERGYQRDGTLASRDQPGAVIEHLNDALAQVRQLLRGTVTTVKGEQIALRAESLCLHGDRPDAAAFARALHEALVADGVLITPPGTST